MPHTGPLSTLRDRTDNILYVSPASGDELANNGFEFADGIPAVFGGASQRPLTRRGNYLIQGVLGGTEPNEASGAGDCGWEHAAFGDFDGQLWNGSGDDPDDTSAPACRTVGSGDIEHLTSQQFARHVLDYDPAGLFTAPQMEARISTPARGIWHDYVRMNLSERGVLSLGLVDPLADGVPSDVVDNSGFNNLDIEWLGSLEVAAVYIKGDTEGGPYTWTSEEAPVYAVDDAIFPSWLGTEYGFWTKGYFGDAAGLVFTADDDWVDLGVTAWPGKSSYADGPDLTVGWTTNAAYTRTAPVLPGDPYEVDHTPLAYPALKYVLRSPYYRWVWDGPELLAPYPIRTLGRGRDGLVGSGTNVLRRSSVQRSNRTLGAKK